MSLDEKITSWFLNSTKKRNKAKRLAALKARNAYFVADHEKELCIFASALWKRALDVKPMQGLGDYDGKTLFLPEVFCISDSLELNKQAALLRILHELRWDLVKENKDELSLTLNAEYPNYSEQLKNLLEVADENREILWPPSRKLIDAKINLPFQSMALPGEEESKNAKSLELKALPKTRVNKLESLKDDNLGDQVFHSFEKIETIEEYNGVDREAEPEDSLDEKSGALEDLNLDSVIRSNERTTQNYAMEHKPMGRLTLTPRETKVAQYLVDGLTNKEIANKLGLSEYTVKDHVKRLMRKTQTTTRTAAVGKLIALYKLTLGSDFRIGQATDDKPLQKTA